MFSPPRTSRRRQRPLSSDLSFSEPKSKRRRSAITQKNTLSLGNTSKPQETDEKNVKKTAVVQSKKDGSSGRELAVRGKKMRLGDRELKGDGSILLSSNDMYTVAKLPALPDRLKSESEKKSRQHGSFNSRNGYALVLTHTHAFVWLYSVNSSSPETFMFTLDQSSNLTSGPLPIGSLVSASASSSIPGLVVVIPSTGKVTYWESVSSAATYDLKLQKNGVELTIPGLSFGETVVQLLNAESVGFILALSSGRIAYMSVRDGHGRPSISVQFLRIGSSAIAGGILGSIRNVLLSSTTKGDIAAIRAAPAEKVGERDITMITTKGKIQYWKLFRGGHISSLKEYDIRVSIFDAVKNINPGISSLPVESFEIIDFTFIPKSTTNVGSTRIETEDIDLIILSSFIDRHHANYFLVRVRLKQNELEIKNVLPIKSYTTPINHNATSKTMIFLPKPALIAFIVFDKAMAVISVTKLLDEREFQNGEENHPQGITYDDVIDFRNEIDVEVVGSGMEQQNESNLVDDPKSLHLKAKNPAVVLLLRGGGVLRISAIDVARLSSSNPQQVNAKMKLEQAIFFGSLNQNPLSFTVRTEQRFSDEEYSSAALSLSSEILESTTPYISSIAASIEQNLQKRSTALHNLAKFLCRSEVKLDRVTKWRLLFNAEKLKAASLVWKRYDSAMKTKGSGDKRSLLLEVVESIHEDDKSKSVSDADELDRVRQWFIKDICNMETALPWAYQVIKRFWRDESNENELLKMVSEANDLVIGALQSAFEFRALNLDLYGLSSEEIEDGVLTNGYKGLPEFWTSTIFLVENTRMHTQLVIVYLDNYYQEKKIDSKIPILIDKIKSDCYYLLDVTIRSNTERIRWCSAQDSQKYKNEAEVINREQSEAQNTFISALASLGLPDEAMDLAEKHQLLTVLASLIKLDLDSCDRLINSKPAPRDFNNLIMRRHLLQSRLQNLFLKFGTLWASAWCKIFLVNSIEGQLFDSMSTQQEYLTKFLRSKLEYAKISWINDVIRERDFENASQALLDHGLKVEDNFWCKKITLSIGKLTLLASHGNDDTSSRRPELILTEAQLGLIDIQEEVFEFVSPVISDALDETVEQQFVIEFFENRSLEKQITFQSSFRKAISKLIKHETMSALELVDLLTIMDAGLHTEHHKFFSCRQFYLALKTISFEPPHGDQSLVQRIIWRRCMLRDDWAEINNTNMKHDEEVAAQSRATILYQTLMMCFKSHLFEKDPNIKPISPQESLGAGIEDLEFRYRRLDISLREKIMKDMQTEDHSLKRLIDRCRLNEWHMTVLDLVKQDLENQIREEEEDTKTEQEAADELTLIEESLQRKESSKVESLLQLKSRYKLKIRTEGFSANHHESI
ncbi:Nucleoporin NUP133 [Golovinomyces cichoracearum]|uniref:Nucleoporin NUP133 n=1 Tax=Golovinomyces cichoracearum TaxID=62708 RepID=A0A420GQ21_9PEZI|nr:Nucleoporin NUP133 [Golovinomyces cichoracearum]